jgi:hypothetical protein
MLPGHLDAVAAASGPDFTEWQSYAARARRCSRPIRLRDWSTTIDPRTGEVFDLGADKSLTWVERPEIEPGTRGLKEPSFAGACRVACGFSGELQAKAGSRAAPWH